MRDRYGRLGVEMPWFPVASNWFPPGDLRLVEAGVLPADAVS
jgi:hypothetical protein